MRKLALIIGLVGVFLLPSNARADDENIFEDEDVIEAIRENDFDDFKDELDDEWDIELDDSDEGEFRRIRKDYIQKRLRQDYDQADFEHK